MPPPKQHNHSLIGNNIYLEIIHKLSIFFVGFRIEISWDIENDWITG